MGHRKRIAAPRSKQTAPAAAPGADASYDQDDAEATAGRLIKSGASSFSAVKQECERALTSLHRGNHTKALRLMKDSCTRNENSAHSALAFRVQGTVCIKVASIIDDPNKKQRHLRNAVDSARKAVELSPNSIEFAHFYANLLYDVANEAKEYEEVVTECERALAIENPIDPAKESLQEESQQKIVNADGRILHVQGELRNLIQKANFASISSWMKNLGGDEKLRLIPIRGRVPEDPMESRSVQARRPNEIRKATKTPEERRKEIEVRVAAARLLQQQSETAGSQSGGGEKGLDSSLGNGAKTTSERKKHVKKNEASSDRKLWAHSYWNSLTNEKKREWFQIKVCDVKTHFAFSKDGGMANDVFSEAVEHATATKTWKYWICCKCSMKFSDSESHLQHAIQEHIGNIFPKLQSSLPQNVDKEWSEMISSCSWKPLDISATLEMLANQQKCHEEKFSLGHDTEECDDCFRDAWDSSPEKHDSRGYNCRVVINADHSSHAENQGLVSYSPPETWPIANDPERAKLLERIHSIFEVLIRHKCLSEGHLAKVLQFTIDELQGLSDGSQLLTLGVNHTPQCICFLGAEQLRKIIKFLQEITGSCGLGKYPEKSSRPLDDVNVRNQGEEINDKIFLNDEASCILLDESLLPTACKTANCHDSVLDVAGHDPAKVDSDADSILSWIYSGSSCTELLASWAERKDVVARHCSENFNLLEKESIALQDMCNRKSQLIGYEEALQVLEELCIEESKRRENGDEFAQRSHGACLKKRAEEIRGDEDDLSFNSSRFESEVIKNILKDAENLNVNQFGYDDAYGVASQLRDLEAAEDEDWRTKDYLQQIDTCIELSFQKQKEESYMEMCKLDTRIMRSVGQLRQLELKFEAGSALDYRWVLVPIVKLYMRTHLEDLAEKDAMEKSDAAREAFLAELALDSNKGVRGGNDLKHGQEKTKDKKKHKKTKAGGINEHSTVYHGTNEPESFTSDGGHPDCEVVAPLDVDEFKEQEDELRRIELEAEVRKLEETLEYQRQMENEAKQRQLAEQHKKLVRVMNEGFVEDEVEPKIDDQPTSPQLKAPMQLVQKIDQSNSSDGILEEVRLDILVPNGSSTAYDTWNTKIADHAEVKKEDDVISSDKRTGRRGRRQRSLTKLQEQSSPSVVEHAADKSPSQVQCRNANDNEGKTLRQLHVEEDDEERFQADLQKAVRQSLDTLQARVETLQARRTLSPTFTMTPKIVDPTDVAVKKTETLAAPDSASDMFGTGLQNEVGEYNCFLNVIIQSLWHIRRFRSEFLKSSRLDHFHVGDPCVVCALREIFSALNAASADARKEPVAPSSLRIALSNLYPDSNFFQEGQMNDASEVLAVIFDCLHKSFTESASDNESVESGSIGSWDCKERKTCPVHSLFGMDIFERMDCSGCGLESRHLKYTSFFHNINASALRTMKLTSAESSFDELLNLAEMNHQLACDPESAGCGKLNHIHHFLSNPPHIFTTVLGWQNTCESADDIAATLAALNTSIDMSVLYRGLDPKHVHNLVSVVCYYGQHYHCFAYSHDHGRWIMYDDRTVKVIGKWEDVLSMCQRGHLQPQVLFYEAI